MSKTLRTAALVVGAVALVATGVGAVGAIAAGTSLSAGIAGATAFGISAATIGTISSGLALASGLLAKKPKSSTNGDQARFTADKNAALPYVMGRTSVSGFIVHRQTHGTNNLYQTFFAVLSAAGPIYGIEAFKVDGVTTSFTPGGAAQGDYAGWMWLRTQLGQTPEASALASPVGAVDGWEGSSKLSGYAAYAWTLKFDEKGKKFAAGVPEPSAVVFGVKCYHPHLDDNYPGGSGPQRIDDESTWSVTDNAFLHGLTWLIGRHQNGKRVIGVGAPLDGIDVAAYVEACNIALANGWKMGGVVYSTDEKWSALKAMLQAGGGEPVRQGARISCTINAPRVSLDTIRSSDLVGDASVAATQSRRDRINAVVPRYRSEAHGWEMVPAKLVKVDAYATEDGGQRTKEIEYPLVQDAATAAQLAAYDIVNAREFGPITLPLKPRWVGYKPGDCLTIDIPELNMVGQTALILNRSLDPSSGVVTLTLKSETPAKHDFALGRTANPPPTPSLQVIDPSQLLIPGVTAVWDDVRDPNLTKPEDNATLGATMFDNVFNSDGSLYMPMGGEFDPSDIYSSLGIVQDDLASTRADLLAASSALALTQAQVTETVTLLKIRPNLQKNGGFGQGLTGLINLPASAAVIQNNGLWGTYLQHQQNGAASMVMPPLNIAAGVTYTASFDSVLIATAGQSYVAVSYWTGPDGTGTGYFPAVYSTPRQATFDFSDTTRQAFSFTTPAGYQSLRLQLITDGVAGITVAAFRKVKLERGGLPASLWSDEATANSVDASIREVDTARINDFASQASRFVGVESRVAATEGVANSAYAGYITTADTLATFTGSQASFNSAVVARFDAVEGVAGGAAAGVITNSDAIVGLNAALSTYQVAVNARFGTNEGNITTALTAASNAQSSVTTLNQTLRSVINANPNLLVNGGLRNGLTGLGYSAPIAVYDDVNWGRLLGIANNGETIVTFPPIAYLNGGPITVSFDSSFFAASGHCKVEVGCYNGPNATGGALAFPQSAIQTSGDFSNTTRREFSFTPPNGTQSLQVRLIARDVTGVQRIAFRRIQLERRDGPASVFSDDATDLALSASVTIQAGTLAELNGKLQAYIRLTAIAGTSEAKFEVVATEGYSRIRLTADTIVLDGDVIASGTVRAAAFMTNAGVDLAAIVPGSLNWRLGTGAGTTYTAQSVDTGIINPTGSNPVTSAHVIRLSSSFVASHAGTTAGSVIQMLVYYRIDGGGWIDTGATIYANTIGTSPQTFSMTDRKFSPATMGTIEFAYRILGGTSDGLGTVNVNSVSVAVEASFFK